jgi:DNA phosphorothioation-dependent restriction protein DptG
MQMLLIQAPMHNLTLMFSLSGFLYCSQVVMSLVVKHQLGVGVAQRWYPFVGIDHAKFP